jgi:hypothetical protein
MMGDNLALYMIGAYAIVFFIAGYIWKSIRDARKQRNINHSIDTSNLPNDQASDRGNEKLGSF